MGNNGYSFCGDIDEFVVKDSPGRVTIRGKRNRDERHDMWKVNLNDLIEDHKANIAVSMHGLRNLNAESLARAHEARDLHCRLGHPRDHAFKMLIDNGLISDCRITSRDLDYSNHLLAKCKACLEGKLLAPSEPTAIHTPAEEVGDVIYLDLLEANEPTLGGDT